MKKVFVLICLVGFIAIMSACGQSSPDTTPPTPPVDPADPDAISAALVVSGATSQSGSLPTPTEANNSPQPVISRSETNVGYSAGSQVPLPLDFTFPGGQNLDSIYFAVVGASSYSHFSFPPDSPASGTVTLPVSIPESVMDGQFCMDIMLEDTSGYISQPQEVCVTVAQPSECDAVRVSGGEGLTSTMHFMGRRAGTAQINYETNTVQDRIDVFQAGVWIAGTGAPTDRLDIRTVQDCAQATEALGYVSTNDQFLFNYDPARANNLEVVVSGCEDAGTLWEYTASCPIVIGQCSIDSDCADGESCVTGTCVGEGVLRFTLSWSVASDFDLHVITPSGNEIFYADRAHEGGQLDVDNVVGGVGSVENVFFDDTAPRGIYTYFVRNYNGNAAGSFSLKVFVGGELIEAQTETLPASSGVDSTRYIFTY